jgi:hypothetical protein
VSRTEAQSSVYAKRSLVSDSGPGDRWSSCRWQFTYRACESADSLHHFISPVQLQSLGIALMMAAVSTSETSANFYQTALREMSEDGHLHTHSPVSYLYILFMFSCCVYMRSRVSSGSIVSDYGLDDRAIGVRSPEGAEYFSSSLCVQTGSGAHPASCTMGTGGPFPGGKSAAGA